MPAHDWTRVPDGTFHDFHVTWIPLLKHTLNAGLLSSGYYAMAEQVLGIIPDVLTLQAEEEEERPFSLEDTGGGGTAVAERPPQVAVRAKLEQNIYAAKANRLVIRHQSRDRVVAILEVVSVGNKSSGGALRRFVERTVSALWKGVHVSLIDLHPPTFRDPQGIHGAIWAELGGEPYQAPPDKPLTLAAYSVAGPDIPIEAYVQPIAIGEVLPPLPLFLTWSRYLEVPLEESYMQAVAEIPARARAPLEA